MDMGEPFGKASGRTFIARSTYVPDPCWNSLWVISSNSLKMSIRPPSEALKGGLPMAISATAELRGYGTDTHLFSLSSSLPVYYDPIDFGKERIILPHSHIFSRMDSSPYLANQDAPCLDLFSAEPFYTQTLS